MAISMSCKRCGHIWNYKGYKKPQVYSQYVSCPICKSLIKLPNNEEETK